MVRLVAFILAIGCVILVMTLSKKPDVQLGAATTPEQIALLEEAYFAKYGKYLQIKENNQLPEYEFGNILTKLGATVDTKYSIDTYESPNGRGYRIRWEDNNGVYSRGYGADAQNWTYTNLKEVSVATST